MTVNCFGWAADQAGCCTWRIRWVSKIINETFPDEIDYRFDTLMQPADRERADVVIGQRIVLPGPSMFWQRWHAEESKYLIMDLDDDLWSVEPHNTRASSVFNKTEVQHRLRENVLACDLVTVSTEPLKEAVNRETGFPLDRIVVIPNAIDPEMLSDPRERPEIDGAPLLGWLASPTHLKDAELVSRALKQFYGRNPDETFRTIGAEYGPVLGIKDNQVKHTGWVQNPEAAIRKIDYRVGICPLVPTVFNKSKSDCKALETGARGVPSIMSDTAAYAAFEHDVTGFKVRYQHEWSKTLNRVASDRDLQTEVGLRAYEYVRDHRTTKNTAALWRDAILGKL